ncbi:hypothetical protein E1212_18550 [Jiangella ureilytica]|uniref:DUF3137 domain-containing protein n=1 Tax=Jiangella ureilytica TaxID=2530374 RepID=A0A4V2XWH3_9ACTN|nr:hypothetical protein [Jiangella ureilytica]TDC49325.1 hypothetical protein E1212_18550 [Jiangella ureilytica]
MEALVVLLFAALAAGVLVVVQYARFAARRRVADLRGFVRSRGWQLTASDGGLTRRWPGPPFHPGGGVARPVVRGTHRGREFTGFEYLYEVTPSASAKTAIPHRHLVVVVPLPGAVPDFAVTRQNAVAGALARVLDLPGAEVPETAGGAGPAGSEFGRRFHVACADPLFAATVLQPLVVQRLVEGPVWEWRLSGTDMIAWDGGHLTPDRLLTRLDAIADVLDRVPAEAWRHGGPRDAPRTGPAAS